MLYFIILILIIWIIIFWWINPNSNFILSIANLHEQKYKTKFHSWLTKCHSIYQLCECSLPLKIEASNKIGKKKFNTHRYSILIDRIPTQVIPYVIALMNVPSTYKHIIAKKIEKAKGEIIYGIDLSCSCGRIYLNQGKNKVVAYEWLEQTLAVKYYSLVSHESMKTYLKLISPKIAHLFLNVLPVYHWDDTCIKYDTREGMKLPCAFYFSSKYSPTLKQVYPTLKPLLEEVYQDHIKDIKDMNQWYHHYQDCTISWYVITQKKGNIEFSIYFNTQGKIWDKLENHMYFIMNQIYS